MKCRKCNGELAHIEESDCYRCLACNPIKATPLPAEAKKDMSVDVRLNKPEIDKLVRDIIKEVVPDMIVDALQDWYIQKPSVTAIEVAEMVEEMAGTDKAVLSEPVFEDEFVGSKVEKESPTKTVLLDPDKVITLEVTNNWRAQAKALGINLFHRTKKSVLAEIAEKIQEVARV